MITIPQKAHTVERQRRGDPCYSALVTVEVERKSTHAIMVRGPQGHEAVPGPLGGGTDVIQCYAWAAKFVTLVQCEVRGREMCARCTRKRWIKRRGGVGE